MRTGNIESPFLEQEMDSVYHENRKWRVSVIRTGNEECLL
jgi:hypothetical protein